MSRTDTIMADSAEPQRIQEICDAGFNCIGVSKVSHEPNKSWVSVGIDRVKRKRLHITKRSVNVLKEIRGYKWKQDKDENVLDEPLKFRDHALDAIRYYIGTRAIEAGITFMGAKTKTKEDEPTEAEKIFNDRYWNVTE